MNRNILRYPIGGTKQTKMADQLQDLIIEKATEIMCKDILSEIVHPQHPTEFLDGDEYYLGILMNALRLEEIKC